MCEFDPVCDREHVEETGGAVEQDVLNNTSVQQWERWGVTENPLTLWAADSL